MGIDVGAGRNNYQPRTQDDVLRLIDTVESKRQEFEITKNPLETKTLCWCLMVSIFQLIRGAYAVLSVSALGAHRVLGRSIYEHIIDLQLIATWNDPKQNRRFYNYRILKLYFVKDLLRTQKHEIPGIIERYREYVKGEFLEELKNAKSRRGKDVDVTDWKSIDSYLRGKYSNSGWSGLDSYTRVAKLKTLIADAEPESQLSVYIDPADMRDHIGLISKAQSDYVHSSVFSAFPHLKPNTGAFQLEYQYDPSDLADGEKLLVMATSDTISAFAWTLSDEAKRQSLLDFGEEIWDAQSVSSLWKKDN